MNRTEEIRKELLLQLYASRPLALTARRIQRDTEKLSYDYSLGEIKRELQFLADEMLVIEIATSPGSTEKLYRISANGVRSYEQALG